MRTTIWIALSCIAVALPHVAAAQVPAEPLVLRLAEAGVRETTFSAANAWRTRLDAAHTLTAVQSGPTLSLIFRPRVGADYLVMNDLAASSDEALSLHSITFAPASGPLADASSRVTLDGEPLKLIENGAGDAAKLILGARDPRALHATFDLAMGVSFGKELHIAGDGNQRFRISGKLTETVPGSALTKSGASTLELIDENQWSGPTVVNAGELVLRSGRSIGTGAVTLRSGGTIRFDALSPVAAMTQGLSVEAGAALDLAGNAWIVDYADGPSPIDMYQRAIADGLIRTSLARATHTIACVESSSLGSKVVMQRDVDGSAVILCDARFGDTNLDGKVDLEDLKRVKESYDQPGSWANGDFNGDGKVNFDDLLKLSQHYDVRANFQADWDGL